MVYESGLDFLNFGFTWSRTHKDGSVLKSAIDHAITNKPAFITNIIKMKLTTVITI